MASLFNDEKRNPSKKSYKEKIGDVIWHSLTIDREKSRGNMSSETPCQRKKKRIAQTQILKGGSARSQRGNRKKEDDRLQCKPLWKGRKRPALGESQTEYGLAEGVWFQKRRQKWGEPPSEEAPGIFKRKRIQAITAPDLVAMKTESTRGSWIGGGLVSSKKKGEEEDKRQSASHVGSFRKL